MRLAWDAETLPSTQPHHAKGAHQQTGQRHARSRVDLKYWPYTGSLLLLPGVSQQCCSLRTDLLS